MSNKFWIGYILFFIFIFPMIFEYMPYFFSGTYGFGQRTSSTMALVYLAVGTIAWLGFIFWYYFNYVKIIGQEVKNIKSILKDGKPITVRVEEKSIEKELDTHQHLELNISFKNLSGTPIHIPYPILDTRPQDRRYEIGKQIPMRLDPELRPPVLVPEGVAIQTNTSTTRVRIFGFILLIAFFIFYLVFSYWLQSNGAGWRFLHFWHPWVTIPFWGLLFGWLLLGLLVGKLIGGLNQSLSSKELNVLFKGKDAQAQVLTAEQTGLTINEQPEIRFKLQFQDDRGNIRTASFKKIISLLSLHTIGTQQRIILYLPEDPTQIMLADEYVNTLSD